MSQLVIKDLPLIGLKLIERKNIGDARGFLSRLFCAEELAAAGWHRPIAQINQSFTAHRGTIRGMHYQLTPYAEMKLVTCIRGKIWDVVIDLRTNSPTFLQTQAELLSADNRSAILIPEGFAHGFQAQTDNCELIYLHAASYNPQAERGLRFDDPQLAITWPLPVSHLSERDQSLPVLTPQFRGIAVL
jgi:dTDP-4-dehydrorhamnose 3,5-epimerase